MALTTYEEYLGYKQKTFGLPVAGGRAAGPRDGRKRPHSQRNPFPQIQGSGSICVDYTGTIRGIGLTTAQYLPIITEMAKVSGAVRALIDVHLTAAGAAIVSLGGEQKAALGPRWHAANHRWLCITEANSGSGLDCKTAAVKKGEKYIPNGEKHLITNADFTDLFMVACYTGPRELGRKAISALLVEAGSPGFTMIPCPTFWAARDWGTIT